MGKALDLIEKMGTTIPSKYSDNDNAMKIIRDEIDSMKREIEQSEKGHRSGVNMVNPEDGQGYNKFINTSTQSTFPKYLQSIFNGSGTSKKFIDAVKKGKGPIWDRIALEAINRLENGYKNHHGYSRPDKDFIDIVKNPIPF